MKIPRDETNPAYQMMPTEIAQDVPALKATDKEEDPVARVKYFTPDSSWTWWVIEYDPKERLCFGLASGLEREFGHFSLDELEALRGPLGLPVERDLHFDPTPVSKCK